MIKCTNIPPAWMEIILSDIRLIFWVCNDFSLGFNFQLPAYWWELTPFNMFVSHLHCLLFKVPIRISLFLLAFWYVLLQTSSSLRGLALNHFRVKSVASIFPVWLPFHSFVLLYLCFGKWHLVFSVVEIFSLFFLG